MEHTSPSLDDLRQELASLRREHAVLQARLAAVPFYANADVPQTETTSQACMERFQTLTRLSQLFSSSFDLDDILRTVVHAATFLMEARAASVWVVDEAAQLLQARACAPEDSAGDCLGKTLHFGEEGVGWVARHYRVLHIPDVFLDARMTDLAWWRAQRLQSLCAVPVMRDNTLLAVLALSRHRPFLFGPVEQWLLQSLTAQAAMAMTHADVVQALRHQVAELTQSNAALQRDMTERRGVEQALVAARDAAEQANLAKSVFLANVSHELRTPLGSVIGFANVLLKNIGPQLRAQDLLYLERIRSNGLHLLALSNGLLDVSKIEAGRVDIQLTPVALPALLQEVVTHCEGAISQLQVALRAEIPPLLRPLRTDADKLKQILINLVGNALKFTSSGGVTVRVEADPRGHDPIRIDVIDTGPGIPVDQVGAILEHFKQVDQRLGLSPSGTGLGLTISRSLCQLLGYHLQVSSEVGRGSIFSIVIPAGGAEATEV